MRKCSAWVQAYILRQVSRVEGSSGDKPQIPTKKTATLEPPYCHTIYYSLLAFGRNFIRFIVGFVNPKVIFL